MSITSTTTAAATTSTTPDALAQYFNGSTEPFYYGFWGTVFDGITMNMTCHNARNETFEYLFVDGASTRFVHFDSTCRFNLTRSTQPIRKCRSRTILHIQQRLELRVSSAIL